MKTHKKIDLHGFTIIEVVLVLAIAGLIFLMVFVALPALQRSQRDTQRRSDMARVVAAFIQWQSNHGGSLPEDSFYDEWGCSGSDDDCSAEKIILEYLNPPGTDSDTNSFKDPDGTAYNMWITSNLYKGGGWIGVRYGYDDKGALSYDDNNDAYTIATEDSSIGDHHVIYVIPGAKCNGEYAVRGDAANDLAMLYELEGSGVYCRGNK